jgi:AcrR family transcriptional regulator
MSPRPYGTQARGSRSQATRARIKASVHELLAEGTFHTSTIEEVAERAGVSRATLYQHFGSRLELIDAMCETFDANPALIDLREAIDVADPAGALDGVIALSVAFWSSEDAVLSQLYGVAAVDPAAQALVDRQRRDRRHELERLVRRLEPLLEPNVTPRRALALLLVLTAYDTYRELRAASLSDREATALLTDSARRLLVAD